MSNTGKDGKTGGVLQSTGGRPTQAATVCWVRIGPAGTELAPKEVGDVTFVQSRPCSYGTVEIRAYGSNYAMCDVLRPPNE